jgi:hypothetical protein
VEKLLIGVLAVVGLFVLLAVIGLLVAFPIMWCWNYAMVTLFHLPVITWGQAWCLNFLAGCLLKSTQTNNNK